MIGAETTVDQLIAMLERHFGCAVERRDVPTPESGAASTLVCRSDHQQADDVARQLRDISIAVIGLPATVRVIGSALLIADSIRLELLSRDGSRHVEELPLDIVEEIYWANFYASHGYEEGSAFCQAIRGRFDLPEFVVDLGCGDGRDSFALAGAGHHVIGLDRSSIAVDHANTVSSQKHLTANARFIRCDFADRRELARILEDGLSNTDGPALFYARFLFHSVPSATQDVILTTISELARPGDLLAAEFRTQDDAELPKVHDAHYRRYQDGATFVSDLQERYGFDPLWTEEGIGLSPYGDEDPVLFRVVGMTRA